MPSVTYTAKRRLMAGHVAATQYSIDFEAEVLSPDYPQSIEHVEALDGSRDTLLWSVAEVWSVVADEVHNDSMPIWLEFLHSVVGGESFTFDPYGTVAVPVSPMTVELQDKFSTPRNGQTYKFNPSFTARVI